MKEPKKGDIIKAQIISTSDWADIFGAPIFKGLYLGNSLMYVGKKRKVFKVNIDYSTIKKKATKRSIEKANEILSKLDLARKQSLEQQMKKYEERDKRVSSIISILEKFGFKKVKPGVFTITVDIESKKVILKMNKMWDILQKIYKMKSYADRTDLVPINKKLLYPHISISRREVGPKKWKIYYQLS